MPPLVAACPEFLDQMTPAAERWPNDPGHAAFPDDFLDFIDALNPYRVKYLLMGGYAVGMYGHVPATGDIDVFYRRIPEHVLHPECAVTANSAGEVGNARRVTGRSSNTHPTVIQCDWAAWRMLLIMEATFSGDSPMVRLHGVVAFVVVLNHPGVAGEATASSARPHTTMDGLRLHSVDCAVKQSAYLRNQVERSAALRAGASWPTGWREVTRPMLPATRTDSVVAGHMGIQAPRGGDATSFPTEWMAFVVDTTGTVQPCSFAGRDGLAPKAPLGRYIGRLPFEPATVAGVWVNQVILLERAR